MQVAYKIRADDGFTDVCKCDEFQSQISGLSIAWLCSKLPSFSYEQCLASIAEKGTGRIHTENAYPGAKSPWGFIRHWRSDTTVAVTVYGKYQNEPISITVVFERCVIQICYPRTLETKILSLEGELNSSISKQFSVLDEKTRQDMGGRVITEYSCRMFNSISDGLRITALTSCCPDSSQRWIAVYPGNIGPEDIGYGEHTYRERLPIDAFVRNYESMEDISKSMCAITWHGMPVEVVCEYEAQKLYVCWDKWLSNEIKEFIQWLNREIYERVFPR